MMMMMPDIPFTAGIQGVRAASFEKIQLSSWDRCTTTGQEMCAYEVQRLSQLDRTRNVNKTRCLLAKK